MSATTNQAFNFSVADFWAQGDSVSHGITLLLVLMSILSWTQIVIKGWQATRRLQARDVVNKFWQAKTLDHAVTTLSNHPGSLHFLDLAHQAQQAAYHFDTQQHKTIGTTLSREEFITRAMRQSISRCTAALESGLTMLASIGSIAPFVGLFGTVWGIYHALLGITLSGSASIDKISGPVGETLIMTAAGLFVAIPAVFAYNAFTRLNRVELMEIDGFAHDLHAYLSTGARLQPRSTAKQKIAIEGEK